MPTKLEERIEKSKAHTAKLERLRRAEIKKERDIQKRKDQRRNYIVGELVTKYFPELTNLEPGTKAENLVIFEPLEAFLSALSTNAQLVRQIKEKVAYNATLNAETYCHLSSSSPECVSGHPSNSESACVRIRGDECG